MEIRRVSRKSAITQERIVASNKKDFSQSFNQARDRKSEEQLEN